MFKHGGRDMIATMYGPDWKSVWVSSSTVTLHKGARPLLRYITTITVTTTTSKNGRRMDAS